MPARANIVQRGDPVYGSGRKRSRATPSLCNTTKKDRAKPYLFCWSRRRDLNPRLLVPRRNTPLLSAFAYVKGVDFTVGCSSPRKNATRFIRGPRIMVREARCHGQPVTLQHNKKRQGKTLSFLLVEATGLEPTTLGPSSQHALIVSLCLRQRRRLYGRLLLSPKKRYSFYSGSPYYGSGGKMSRAARHSATQQKKTGQNPIFFVGRGDGT